MRVKDHMAKAARIENTMMQKLDLQQDYETVIENCMLAGVHLLNAILHKLGITEEEFDLLHATMPKIGKQVPPEVAEAIRLHSTLPKIDKQVPPEVAEAIASVKYIEDLRPFYVRGNDPWKPEDGEKCLSSYRKVKGLATKVL